MTRVNFWYDFPMKFAAFFCEKRADYAVAYRQVNFRDRVFFPRRKLSIFQTPLTMFVPYMTLNGRPEMTLQLIDRFAGLMVEIRRAKFQAPPTVSQTDYRPELRTKKPSAQSVGGLRFTSGRAISN